MRSATQKIMVVLCAVVRNGRKSIFGWLMRIFPLLYYILVHFAMPLQYIKILKGYLKMCDIFISTACRYGENFFNTFQLLHLVRLPVCLSACAEVYFL